MKMFKFQATSYSGLSEAFAEPKSLTQIIKKEFLEVASNLKGFVK